MAVAVETPDTKLAVGPLLTALDRCDACGARAYAKAIFAVTAEGEESSLLFCGHHWKRHRDKALAVALAHHDETSQLAVFATKATPGDGFA